MNKEKKAKYNLIVSILIFISLVFGVVGLVLFLFSIGGLIHCYFLPNPIFIEALMKVCTIGIPLMVFGNMGAYMGVKYKYGL